MPEKARKYLIDFKLPNGLVLETKGYFPREERQKMLFVLACNPGLNLLMVFSNPEKPIYKKSKTTYAMWCDEHNIPWIGVEDFEKLLEGDKDAYLLFKRDQRVGLKGLGARGSGFLARFGQTTVS